ncbi:HAMP domain-containing sensor histidine kinase [Streptomyces sp. ID05-26A]|nr:HAMP domain-containing sensor histidine kinase [Streptomyces sp. ID05-26A]
MRRLATYAFFRACGAVAAVLVILAVALVVWYEHDLARERDIRDATIVAEVLTATSDADVIRAAIGRTSAGRSGRLEVRLVNGTVLGMSSGAPAFSLPARAEDGNNAVVSVVATPAHLPAITITVLAVAAVMAVAGSVPLLVRPLLPVARALTMLTEVARDGQGRVQVNGPHELQVLAEAINAAADRTEDLLSKEREMVADVSHRLRTPLTALRLDADAIESGETADRIRASIGALERDVNRIIHSLRPSKTATTALSCDLTAAVKERMTFWSSYAETQKRSLDVALTDEPTAVPLSREDVDAVVDTLLANVFQHTPPSAPVAVEIVRHAGWITLVVEDGGPGVADPSGALRRGASGSGSTGLGLDIARSAVEATGGRIIVDKGRLGGARVRLKMSEAGREQSPEDPRAWRLWSKNNGRQRNG